MKLIEDQFSFLGGKCELIKDIILKICSHFCNHCKDEHLLYDLIFSKDFENRDALYMISTLDITELMDNGNMEKIALELW